MGPHNLESVEVVQCVKGFERVLRIEDLSIKRCRLETPLWC